VIQKLRLIGALTGGLALIAGAADVPAGAAIMAAKPIKWGKPVWSASFNQPKFDRSRWYVYDSPEAATPRVPQAVHQRHGELQLIGAVRNGRDASGGVQEKYSQKYGRWEVRFRADRGAGYSAVVLLWPTSEKWPDDGEIDLMEVGNPTRQTASPWLHNGNPEKKISTPHSIHADFTKWHTVAVDWLPGSVTYYLDGKKFFRVAKKGYVPHTTAMNLALQLDKGCDGVVSCRNGKTPRYVTMHVDWVKIYKLPR
jgi:beta-glucanase (GH16 family)